METIPMGTTTVQYEGVLDDQKFYNFFRDALKGLGYKAVETSFVQFAGGNYTIDWNAKRLIDDYMAYKMAIRINYRGLTESAAVQNGKQVKVKTGTVSVTIVSDIILDYMDKWTSGLPKLIRPIYDKMNQDVLTQRKTAFENDIQNLKTTLQSHFA
jgi:hypothetical protein